MPSGNSTSSGETDARRVKAGDDAPLTFAMTLSLTAGVAMLLIKAAAFLLTGSSAILGDAAESVVHVAAVAFAFYSLRLSRKPADKDHLYGHAKISFFSAGFEGAMIVLAALYILYEAIRRWAGGLELDNLGLGAALVLLAGLVNGALGWYLVRVGRRRGSIILIANGKHVLTDCWTSLGVIVGLSLALITGWLPWDPIAAILVALNILCSGLGLIRQSVGGLMDAADPELHQTITALLEHKSHEYEIQYHDLRHRSLGDTYWVEVHLLFQESMPIGEAHRIATVIENAVAAELPKRGYVSTHLEAIEDHQQVHSNSGD
ncbi:MAG: cation diffusion facilitator family transporter [Pirellulaceae bacterium]